MLPLVYHQLPIQTPGVELKRIDTMLSFPSTLKVNTRAFSTIEDIKDESIFMITLLYVVLLVRAQMQQLGQNPVPSMTDG